MTSSMMTSAPAARRARMCAAKSSGVSFAVAKTSFAFGAMSWTISSIAVPSSPLPLATIRTSAGRLPEATEAARLATPSERTPTVTPSPDSLTFDRARSAPCALSPSETTGPATAWELDPSDWVSARWSLLRS